jgi:hypothetical protein
MEWTGYDYARKLWYYYDASTNAYVYENGLQVAGAIPNVAYVPSLLQRLFVPS